MILPSGWRALQNWGTCSEAVSSAVDAAVFLDAPAPAFKSLQDVRDIAFSAWKPRQW